MTEHTLLVTKKGQVTIPVEHRRKFGIRAGMHVLVKDVGDGVLIKPLIPVEELAGVIAGQVSVAEMRKKLDKMRAGITD